MPSIYGIYLVSFDECVISLLLRGCTQFCVAFMLCTEHGSDTLNCARYPPWFNVLTFSSPTDHRLTPGPVLEEVVLWYWFSAQTSYKDENTYAAQGRQHFDVSASSDLVHRCRQQAARISLCFFCISTPDQHCPILDKSCTITKTIRGQSCH